MQPFLNKSLIILSFFLNTTSFCASINEGTLTKNDFAIYLISKTDNFYSERQVQFSNGSYRRIDFGIIADENPASYFSIFGTYTDSNFITNQIVSVALDTEPFSDFEFNECLSQGVACISIGDLDTSQWFSTEIDLGKILYGTAQDFYDSFAPAKETSFSSSNSFSSSSFGGNSSSSSNILSSSYFSSSSNLIQSSSSSDDSQINPTSVKNSRNTKHFIKINNQVINLKSPPGSIEIFTLTGKLVNRVFSTSSSYEINNLGSGIFYIKSSVEVIVIQVN